MLKTDCDFKNYLTTATACNYFIDLPSINIFITDNENQNMSPATKSILGWHF